MMQSHTKLKTNTFSSGKHTQSCIRIRGPFDTFGISVLWNLSICVKEEEEKHKENDNNKNIDGVVDVGNDDNNCDNDDGPKQQESSTWTPKRNMNKYHRYCTFLGFNDYGSMHVRGKLYAKNLFPQRRKHVQRTHERQKKYVSRQNLEERRWIFDNCFIQKYQHIQY